MAEERKRELALPPGTHAYVLDSTKGVVKVFVGPTVITTTGQDQPVKFNPKTFEFEQCALEQAMQHNIVVPEGFYAVLVNPAKRPDKTLIYPSEGQTQATPELLVGLKENIPGPVSFALFPGQICEVRRGHHLRSNEYLLIKVYNEEKARENWSKAVIKESTAGAGTGETSPAQPAVVAKQAPEGLAVGKQYNILGTEASFYIPPTGVSVVPEGLDEEGKSVFVRAAETLEQLEYAVLVDEDGNKRYVKGPTVVFPRPTERFLATKDGARKDRAIEMNELQGIQLKFIAPVKLTFADGSEHEYKAGEEIFITGKEMPIYYPAEGHQIVKYDGKSIHYAAAVPEGEARYVMDRKTSRIETVKGPTMLLPNPVERIIVRRALSDWESMTWFPGSDGNGSKDALAYNQWLRSQASKEPTTRQGVVSEGNVERNAPGGAALYSAASDVLGYAAMDAMAMNLASTAPVVKSAALRSGGRLAPESRQGKNQDAMVGDVAERKSNYNEPRTLTFANKYKGVPTIKVQQGYAVQVADSDGNRTVHVGPTTRLLNYDDTLDALALSTGKPKSTDRLFRTAYLNIANNKVSDIVRVETQDLVEVELKLIYNVNFEGDQSKWFAIENYVKHLCDRNRSVLKGKIRKLTIESFYGNSTDAIRDAILGIGKDGAARPGMAFPENGMRVTDVEVLAVKIADERIGQLMSASQQQVIQQNIALAQAKSRLDATRQQEQIARDEAEAKFETTQRKLAIDGQVVVEGLKLELAKLEASRQQNDEGAKLKQAQQTLLDIEHERALLRKKASWNVEEAHDKAKQDLFVEQLRAQTLAIAEQMKAVDPALVAALESASARDTLVKVAENLSFHQMMGAENGVDFLSKVFANTPLQGLINKALHAASSPILNGGAKTSA